VAVSVTDPLYSMLAAVVERVRPGRPAGHGRAWATLEAHHDKVEDMVEKGLTVVKVGDLLTRQGIVVPERTLWRYCAERCPSAPKGTVRLADPEPGRDDQGGARSERRGRGAGIRNLREALPGDDPRDIHWPQTARQGSPIVRERDSEESRSAVVLLEGGGSGFEEAVSEAAGAVLQLLARGERVGLVAGEVFVPPGEGRRQRRALLEALAVAAPDQAPPVPLPGDVALYLIRAKATGRVGP